MKKIVLAISILATTLAFAQKKEISSAFKAIESGDVATANSQIAAAESAFGNKTYLLEPSVLEQYYYTKGLSLIKSNKTAEGATYLAKIVDLGKSKIYAGKDASKNKVYYVGKAAADASGVQGLKEETYTTTTTQKLAEAVNPIIQSSSKAAIDAYNTKNYAVAAPKFEEVYGLMKAAGQDSDRYLYYAALNYALADKKDDAITAYKQLLANGYTGAEESFVAKNKKTGEITNLDKSSWDLNKKLGEASEFTDFKTEKSKSIEPELYETISALYIETEKYNDALASIDQGLKKFPDNAKLSELQGTAYHRSGKTDEFVTNLKAQLAKNPNDKTNWYNLGVLQSKDPAQKEEALASYKKAIELDPKFTMAYQNITFLLMGDDKKSIDDYNNLRKAGKMDEANKVLEDRRNRFSQALPYAEKWYAADPNNIDSVSLLKGLYQSTKNEAKAAEFKAKEAALAAGTSKK